MYLFSQARDAQARMTLLLFRRLIINFGLGDYAEKDSVLMTLYSNDKNKLEEAARRAENIFRLTDRPTDQPPLIYSVI